MPKINGNEIKPNNVLEHNGNLWVVVKVAHVKPGKGGAFAQIEMRNLRTGSKPMKDFDQQTRLKGFAWNKGSTIFIRVGGCVGIHGQ